MTPRLGLLCGCLAACLAGLPATAQQDPAGLWSGQWLRDGSPLAVDVSFAHTPDGYQGSFSSAALRVVGIPFSDVQYEHPTLRWDLVGDATTMRFEGTLQGDTLAGRFQEGTAAGTFLLTRTTPTQAPLVEQEIAFTNGPVRLSATLVSPAGAGPFPGIVFLHGSGAEGRWASRFLAEAFAQQGLAALIYDKRGVGASTGDWRTAGFADLVGDAGAALEALRAHPRIDPDRVGIHGHSQGGTLAPWVASTQQPLAFVVASAAAGLSMAETETYSVENALNVRAMAPTERSLAERYVRALVATAYEGAPWADLQATWQEVRDRPWAFAPPAASDPYWSFSHRIAAYDPLVFWRRVRAPVLLLYGEADERVPPRPSAARIAAAYLGAEGSRLEVLFFGQADHGYRLRQSAAEGFAWPVTAPGYPARMIAWVLRVLAP